MSSKTAEQLRQEDRFTRKKLLSSMKKLNATVTTVKQKTQETGTKQGLLERMRKLENTLKSNPKIQEKLKEKEAAEAREETNQEINRVAELQGRQDIQKGDEKDQTREEPEKSHEACEDGIENDLKRLEEDFGHMVRFISNFFSDLPVNKNSENASKAPGDGAESNCTKSMMAEGVEIVATSIKKLPATIQQQIKEKDLMSHLVCCNMDCINLEKDIIVQPSADGEVEITKRPSLWDEKYEDDDKSGILAENEEEEKQVVERKAADEKPVDDKAADGKLVDETPAEETTAEETPAEEKTVEDKSVEENPVEEKPVEEKPAEDKRVGDKPSEDKLIEEKADKPSKDKPVEDEANE